MASISRRLKAQKEPTVFGAVLLNVAGSVVVRPTLQKQRIFFQERGEIGSHNPTPPLAFPLTAAPSIHFPSPPRTAPELFFHLTIAPAEAPSLPTKLHPKIAESFQSSVRKAKRCCNQKNGQGHQVCVVLDSGVIHKVFLSVSTRSSNRIAY